MKRSFKDPPAGFEPASSFARSTCEDLRWLSEVPTTKFFYLAGSGALSRHLGHRSDLRSLQMMSETNRLSSTDRRDLLAELLAGDSELRVETARDGYLFCRTGRSTALRFFYYPYPLIGEMESIENLAVASLADLGLMKLGAIISRGYRADFYDLFLVCQEVSLPDLLDLAPSKFEHVRDFPLQALKGIADLSLARNDSDPLLSTELTWSRVKNWVETEVAEVARDYLRLID